MTAERKNQIGEAIYPLIEAHLTPLDKVPLAGKVTGMLLESLDQSELMQLLESNESLVQKVSEALEVLAVANQIPDAK